MMDKKTKKGRKENEGIGIIRFQKAKEPMSEVVISKLSKKPLGTYKNYDREKYGKSLGLHGRTKEGMGGYGEMMDEKIELYDSLEISLTQYTKLSKKLKNLSPHRGPYEVLEKYITNLEKRIELIERTSEALRGKLKEQNLEPLTSEIYKILRDRGFSPKDITLSYEPKSPQSLGAMSLNYNKSLKRRNNPRDV